MNAGQRGNRAWPRGCRRALFSALATSSRWWRTLLLALTALLSAGPVFPLAARAEETASPRRLVFFQTTDLHGAEALTTLGSVIAGARAEAVASGADTVLLDCGDLLQGSYASSLDRGRAMVAGLNALNCAVWVPGNHDFDFGLDTFCARVREFRGQVVCANYQNFPPGVSLVPFTVLACGPLRVAVIGLTVPGVAVEPPVQEIPLDTALARALAQAEALKPDLIVLAVHGGEYTALGPGPLPNLHAAIRKYPQLPVVFGGHSHEVSAGRRLPPKCWFVQAPAHAGGAIELELTLTGGPRPRLLAVESRILLPDPAAPVPPELLAARRFADRSEEAAALRIPATSDTDGWVAAALRLASGAEAAFARRVDRKKLPAPEQDRYRIEAAGLFALMPYEDQVTVLELTPEEIAKLKIAQADRCRKWGAAETAVWVGAEPGGDGRNAVQGRIRVAMSSYDANGANGRLPGLKVLVADPRTARQDLRLTVREALRRYLETLSVPGTGRTGGLPPPEGAGDGQAFSLER